VNVSHDVVPPHGFLFGGHFEVDVVDLRFQFLDLNDKIIIIITTQNREMNEK
jgi:hypothetical protein